MNPHVFPSAVLPTALSKEDRNWAMAAHLSAFAGHLFPFAHLIAPFIIWLVRKDRSPFVDDQGKEAVNAQLSVTLYAAVGAVLCFVLVGFLMLAALYVANLVFVILAAVAASEGRTYRYPCILRLVK